MKGMSYESIDPKNADKYLSDDDWVAEQKLDGVRIMIHVEEDRIRFRGPNGPEVNFSAASQWFEKLLPSLTTLPKGAVIDGELLIEKGVYWAFDLPYLPGMVSPEMSLDERRNILEHLIPLLGGGRIQLVPQARSTDAKRSLWARVQSEKAEGIVVKRRDAKYYIGRRTGAVLKIKDVKSVDCIIIDRDVDGTCNAVLGLLRDGEVVNIGSTSMLGKPDLPIGAICEVDYLYVADGKTPRLYQPRLMRARPDKTAGECQWRQIAGEITSRAVIEVEEPQVAAPRKETVTTDKEFWEEASRIVEQGEAFAAPLPSDERSGRGPTGRLRNFKQMQTAKLEGVLAEVRAQGNDPDALAALEAEVASRVPA